MTPTLAQQVAEAQQWVRELQTAASKPGKSQALAQLRLANAQAIVETLHKAETNPAQLPAATILHVAFIPDDTTADQSRLTNVAKDQLTRSMELLHPGVTFHMKLRYCIMGGTSVGILYTLPGAAP